MFTTIIFIAIISLSAVLFIISMLKVIRIAEFLMDNVIQLFGIIFWMFVLTHFLAALFFWFFGYGIAAYAIAGLLLTLVTLLVFSVLDSFDIVLDLVYSDFFGLFVFLYLGIHIGFGIYFYSIDFLAPAFILPFSVLFYFGATEMLIHRKKGKLKFRTKTTETIEFTDQEEKLEIQIAESDELEEKPGMVN